MPRWRPPATVEDLNLERSCMATAAKIRETARSESSSCQPRTLLRVKLSGKGSAPCVGWKQRQLTVCLSVSLVPLAKAVDKLKRPYILRDSNSGKRKTRPDRFIHNLFTSAQRFIRCFILPLLCRSLGWCLRAACTEV